MVLIQIVRLDEPRGMAYTNTGLREFLPDKEEFIWEFGKCPKAAFILYDNNWDSMFDPKLMRMVSWYVRSYFSTSKNLDVRIKIK